MTRDDVQRWLDRYVEAWRTYDPDAIGDLFAEGATYRWNPFDDDVVVGRAAIVAAWRDNPDAPGSWSAHYEPWAVDGDRAVAVGESRYLEADGSLRTLFHNIFLLRFDADGRCVEYADHYMELPAHQRAES
jgi:hypothetical protein